MNSGTGWERNEVPGLDRIRRSQLIREAEGYLELGMPQHTLDVLSRLPDAGTFRSHILYLQGEALRALDRYEEALLPLTKAAELAPSNVHVCLAQGWCYKRIGRLDLAIECLERALENDEPEAIVYYNLACYWSLAQNKDNALVHLAKAFELEPGYRDLVESEHDFDPIRDDPNFQALTSIIV